MEKQHHLNMRVKRLPDPTAFVMVGDVTGGSCFCCYF